MERRAKKKGSTVVLKGVDTSGGICSGLRFIGSGDFSKLKPGDVLVAVTTTPAWTPLFASASAVVTDIGGPLSHSSIVAREYGYPGGHGHSLSHPFHQNWTDGYCRWDQRNGDIG